MTLAVGLSPSALALGGVDPLDLLAEPGQADVGPVSVPGYLCRPPVLVVEEALPRLQPVTPRLDMLTEQLRRADPLAERTLHGREAITVDIEASDVGDGKGPEERKPETE